MKASRRLVVCAMPIFACAGAILAVSPATSVASASPAPVPTVTPDRALYDVGITHTVAPGDVDKQGLVPKLKIFSNSVVDSGTTYNYKMVGKDPSKKVTKPATTIKTQLIPLRMVLPNGHVYDPTVADSCDAGASALTRVQNSSLVVGHPWTWGGTAIGSGQYVDAFQRASFWKYAKPGGINPTYAVNLSVTTLPKVTINVPSSTAAEGSAPCGNGHFGAAEVNWLDGYLKNTVIPSLASSGVNASTFPLFLVHNFVEYINVTSNCCVLGFHNAYNHNGIQTYGISQYDNTGIFGSAFMDTATLSHEVGEWMDDPFGNNPTRPWGHIGQVAHCQGNLEVGDPLSGTGFTDTVGGFTYHLQELAFFSWFYRQSPSLGVNGWFSNKGTFTTTQGNCVP